MLLFSNRILNSTLRFIKKDNISFYQKFNVTGMIKVYDVSQGGKQKRDSGNSFAEPLEESFSLWWVTCARANLEFFFFTVLLSSI